MTGCSKQAKAKIDTLVLTVDDSKIYLDEMMYHVMLAEMQGQLYESFVGEGDSYWDIKNDEGITMAEATKDMAMENAIKYELLYNIALDEGYELSEEEKAVSISKVDNILNNIQGEQLQSTELTKEKLIEIQDKIAIATKYYDDFVKTLGVDETAIKANINQVDYKQYDIEYIFAQEQNYDTLNSLLADAKTAEDFTTLVQDTDVTSGTLSFLEGEDTFGEETNLEDEIKVMKAGEVSDVIQTVKGYYIIKLVDNTSTEKYDSAVNEALDNAVVDAFNVEYEAIKKEHTITIKQKIWDQIELGSTVIK
jgi:foldase protein PrsA